MTFKILMNEPFLIAPETIMFLVYKSLLITSSTVVFLIPDVFWSTVNGVQPVIKKWHLGVGINEAINPTISLFMQPGYLRVVVDAAITVETIELIYSNVGCKSFNQSTAILFRALLSSTTTESAFKVSHFKLNKQLYGYTTTSLMSGNTE